MELTAGPLEEPQLLLGRRGRDPQTRGSPRILRPDLVPRAAACCPWRSPCGLSLSCPWPTSVAGHQERPDQGACRRQLEGPEASLPLTWMALAFSLVLLSPLWPPPALSSPRPQKGSKPSPGLFTPLCSAHQRFSVTSSLCTPLAPPEPPPGAAILNALCLCPLFHASGPPFMRFPLMERLSCPPHLLAHHQHLSSKLGRSHGA